jgi:hypothetical protein
MMLRGVGYWIDPGLPDTGVWRAIPQVILAKLGPRPPDPQLVSYLRRGHRFELWRGWSWCRFHCGVEGQPMGHADLTDGTWVWSEGLAHYVEAHGLALPDEFVELAQANRGLVPPLPKEVELMTWAEKDTRINSTFWNNWYEKVAGRPA